MHGWVSVCMFRFGTMWPINTWKIKTFGWTVCAFSLLLAKLIKGNLYHHCCAMMCLFYHTIGGGFGENVHHRIARSIHTLSAIDWQFSWTVSARDNSKLLKGQICIFNLFAFMFVGFFCFTACQYVCECSFCYSLYMQIHYVVWKKKHRERTIKQNEAEIELQWQQLLRRI